MAEFEQHWDGTMTIGGHSEEHFALYPIEDRRKIYHMQMAAQDRFTRRSRGETIPAEEMDHVGSVENGIPQSPIVKAEIAALHDQILLVVRTAVVQDEKSLTVVGKYVPQLHMLSRSPYRLREDAVQRIFLSLVERALYPARA